MYVKLATPVPLPLQLPKRSESALLSLMDRTHYRVKAGDSMTEIWKKQGLPLKKLYALRNIPEFKKQLRKLKPGIELTFVIDAQHNFVTLSYPISLDSVLEITAAGEARTIERPIEQRSRFAKGQINNNFWNAALNAGLNESTLMELAGIFSWDIDFANDLRQGDSFSLLYTDRYQEGQYIGPGEILAAEFINQGHTYIAIRSQDGRYYTPEGKAMRKSFLRAPVNFRYISSSFNPKRLHPVTGLIRPHRGIDYVAPIGTPIMASGDGTVIRSSRNALNGNYVFIRHNATYTTKYLHMTKRVVKTGQRVRQGQVIGTLGRTGRVTGAHLHYEFLVNGVHRNPKTVTLPQATSLHGKALATFLPLAKQRLGELKQIESVLIAMR